MICDVAKYQGEINWSELSPNLDFVVIKASGKTKDPYFDRNAAEAVAHGVPWHAYHFLYCTTEARAKAEAKLFSDSVGKFSPLVWVLDCEAAWGVADRKAQVIAEVFESELRNLRGKDIRVALYVANQKYKDWSLDYAHYYYVWIPRYRKVDVGLPNGPRPDHACDLWQYTSKGTLPGISGDVDLDRLIGTKPLSYFTNPTGEKERDTMATVKIGSARIDENGNATGGKAGDQTGKEVSTQNWYKHNKGWRVFRAKNSDVAEKIAWDMQAACDNPKIGYDQSQRDTLYTVAKLVGFNCAKVQTACETDCSALVRVCCAYAGVMLPNIRTTNEPKALLDSGEFVELTGAKYTDQADYLRRGDILCTKTQGHTVVVLSSGSKAEVAPVAAQGLSRGDHGSAVTAMQEALLKWDPTCLPKYGADGDFGGETEAALRAFQAAENLPVTGVYDQATRKALTTEKPTEEPENPNNNGGTDDSELSDEPAKPVASVGQVVIREIHVRSAPGDNYMSLGVVQPGYRLPYQGEKKPDSNGVDWYLVEYDGQNGWVSSAVAEVVK
ncbi:MAG: peptidoglycan-binding protein [Bacteroidales bacterium]|nr:peptidoglycan-binding protein [Bacteroidales bacterium]